MQLDTITSIPHPRLAPGKQREAACVRKGSRLRQTFPLTLVLFALWVVLSGKWDAFHLLMGAASAFCISLGTRRLLLLPPAIGPDAVHPMAAVPWRGLLTYVPWLGWQIVLASLQVAAVVLHPRMPMRPHLVRFRAALPHTLARLTLANSITLTPGTVTLDVQGDEFLVHALTDASARGLAARNGEVTMPQRVAALYAVSEPRQTRGVTA